MSGTRTRAFAACARTCCRRAFYERLIEASDLGQVIKELMDTEYGPDLEEQLVHGRTAAVIDDALKNEHDPRVSEGAEVPAPGRAQAALDALGTLGRLQPQDDPAGGPFPRRIRGDEDAASSPSATCRWRSSKRSRNSTTCASSSTRWRCGATCTRCRCGARTRSTRRATTSPPLELALDRQYAEWAAVTPRGRDVCRWTWRARFSACRSTRPTS